MTEDNNLIPDELLQQSPQPSSWKAENRNQVVSFAEDITERNSAELMLLEQNRLLELIAFGKPMDECLTSVCASVSKLKPGVRACILLSDDQQLKFSRSITPDFAPSFGQGLKNDPISELAIGTCGEAVYCGQPITCADIANDTRWSQGWRDLCVAHGVLACHSAPIMGMDKLPLGSLMLCFDEVRMPTDWEYRLAEFGTKVASIVFECDRSSLALRESEEKYRTLFNSMGEAFALCEIILDDEGKPYDVRILEVNPAQETMTGFTTEETVGNTIRSLIPDMDNELFEIYGRVALSGETIRFENYVEGLSRWFEIYAYKVGENNEGKFALIYSDITDRKQAEKALQDSQELKQRILESSNDCIKVLTLNSEILYISPGGLCLMEIEEPTSVLNNNWIDFWQGEEQENAKAAIATAKAGNIGQFQGYCPTRKDKPKWWDSIITPLRNASGQVTQLVAISRDITRQKQAEESSRRSEERFEGCLS